MLIKKHLNFRHRAINIFLRTYQELWLADENVGQEVIIEDLTVSHSCCITWLIDIHYFDSHL